MSNEPPPEEVKKPWYRRIFPTSVAGKAALATAIALILILFGVWMLRLFGPESVRLRHAMTVPRMLVEFALAVVIPLVLYWGIRRWNQVIEGAYPDIDRAWEAGINALEVQGIDPTDFPIFLILGSSGDEVERGLMEALDTQLRVHGIPDATGVSPPLQWYVSENAIYLFCPGASSLSALMGRWTTPTMPTGIRRPVRNVAQTPNPKPAAKSDDGTAVPPLPKIERAKPTAATSSPVTATAATQPAAAATSAPTPLKKESALKPVSPKPEAKQPDAYLGTIGFGAIDAAPSGGFASPVQAPSPFAAAPPVSPSPPAAPATPRPPEPLRPAPKFDGTIGGFDQPMPSAPGSPSVPSPPSTPIAAPFGSPSLQPKNGNGNAPSGTLGPGTPAKTPAAESTPSPSAKSAIDGKKPATAPKPAVSMPRIGASKVALPASLDTSEQLPRLRYVCKLLKRVRRPKVGANGAVTLIPFELSRVGPLQLSAISQAARSDVGVIQETLGVRSPVTAVLVGLEQDKGFIELVRRLQPGLLSRRLGGRFDLRSRPTPEELNIHSDRLCDAFEDWVYRLFGREDGLAQQRGNRKLYALISKIRHELKPRLRIVLGNAFGCEPSENLKTGESDDAFFFSGCYFAASGATTGQPAFVKGVFNDKLVDEQSKVEWTKAALQTHFFFRLFSIIGWIVAATAAVLVLAKWFAS